MTGLSTQLISELINDKNKTYSRYVLEKVIMALNVKDMKDMNEVFEVIEED